MLQLLREMRALIGGKMITDTWLGLYDRPTDALNDINSALSAKYNTGNLTQWKQEQKGLSPRAYNFMLQEVLSKRKKLGYDDLRMPDPKKAA